jgi:hypothetical protein
MPNQPFIVLLERRVWQGFQIEISSSVAVNLHLGQCALASLRSASCLAFQPEEPFLEAFPHRCASVS